MPDFAFEPNAPRGRSLDRGMLAGLADSLQHIREQADGAVDFDGERIDALIGRLRDGQRHGPAAFAHYYDLVPALVAEQRGEAEALFARLAAIEPIAMGLTVKPFDALEREGVAASFRAKFDTDPETRFDFVNPPPDLVQPFTQRFLDGMALLDVTVPELAGEVRGLLSDILLAVGPSAPESPFHTFDGGSSYMLWGALVLNAEYHPTLVAMAEAISHEAAHSLLFGFAVDEPLTLNDEEERYDSPLRFDPRPMDGIYHATFVSARMHWVMTRLAESGRLNEEDVLAARAAAAGDAKNFGEGYETVARHGKLSMAGSRLMANAKAYMDHVAA